MALRWFDGHLDMAFLADQGRDFTKKPLESGGFIQPAAVTFSSLAEGNVKGALATIFNARSSKQEKKGPWNFVTLEEAGIAARRQLAIYARWEREGWVENVTRKTPLIPKLQKQAIEPLKIALMEGAVGLQRVEEFDEFYAAGVRVVSLTWAEGSIWCGGDHWGGDVTGIGRELLARMDELGIVHDVSHLSEQAFWTMMRETKGMKVASHSNCRSLVPGYKYPERHLSDEQILAIAKAGGIIGINLYSNFLVPEASGRRATLADVLRHMAHMEKLVGRRDFLALGSDMDGGFSREKVPVEIDGPEKFGRFAEALSAAGWSDAEIERFAWGNWSSVLGRAGVTFK